MPPDDDKVTMSKAEYDLSIKVAVQEKQLDILIADFQRSKEELNKAVNMLTTSINKIPSNISQCKNDLEKDIMQSAESKYVTHGEINAMKNKIIGAVLATGLLLSALDLAFRYNFI